MYHLFSLQEPYFNGLLKQRFHRREFPKAHFQAICLALFCSPTAWLSSIHINGQCFALIPLRPRYVWSRRARFKQQTTANLSWVSWRLYHAAVLRSLSWSSITCRGPFQLAIRSVDVGHLCSFIWVGLSSFPNFSALKTVFIFSSYHQSLYSHV